MLGFTEGDIQLQERNIDTFVKHLQPQFLSELQSIQLLGSTETSRRTSSADLLADKSLAIKSEPSQSHSLSKKCVIKASFVKHQHRASLSRLQRQRKHEFTKLSGKSWFLSLSVISVLNLKLDVPVVIL